MARQMVLCCECSRVHEEVTEAIACCKSNKVVDIIVPDFCPRCCADLEEVEYLDYDGEKITECDYCEDRLEMEDKVKCVENLEKLLKDIPYSAVKSLKYIKDRVQGYVGEEVVVTYKGGSTKRINVYADSEIALCRDVLKQV